MPATSHPVFVAPEPRSSRIWRYMDFTKYVWMLQNSALFFSRADLLGDPFEGSISVYNQTQYPAVYADVPLDFLAKLSASRAAIPTWTYVNSWHVNERESAAMWRLYLTADEGIAVISTYERLFAALPVSAYLGLVSYLDYDREWMNESNVFYPFVHKRRSFEHERELRAVIQSLPVAEGQTALSRENSETGRIVPVNLTDLVESVRIAPTAAEWFSQLVAEVSAKYQITNVTKSDLASAPFF